MQAKLPCSFKIWNDTNKFIVIIDRYYQSFDKKKDAYALISLLPPCIEDSGFGEANFIAPNARWTDKFSDEVANDKISDYKEINLMRYIDLHKKRSLKNFLLNKIKNPMPAIKRMQDKKNFDDFWKK